MDIDSQSSMLSLSLSKAFVGWVVGCIGLGWSLAGLSSVFVSPPGLPFLISVPFSFLADLYSSKVTDCSWYSTLNWPQPKSTTPPFFSLLTEPTQVSTFSLLWFNHTSCSDSVWCSLNYTSCLSAHCWWCLSSFHLENLCKDDSVGQFTLANLWQLIRVNEQHN